MAKLTLICLINSDQIVNKNPNITNCQISKIICDCRLGSVCTESRSIVENKKHVDARDVSDTSVSIKLWVF